MKKILFTIFAIIALFTTVEGYAQKITDLSGRWEFRIDRQDVGEKQGWYKPTVNFDDAILLPGSMPERSKGDNISVNTQWVGALYDSSYYHNPYMEKYRHEGDMLLPFFLTPKKHYVGKAWYRTTVRLSAADIKYDQVLTLERPHIMTKVWVNGKEVVLPSTNKTPTAGWMASLSVPHNFRISRSLLVAGKNTITVCVDNDPTAVCVGKDSHSVTDQTQGCWNGLAGKIELRSLTYVESMKVYPDVDNKLAVVKLRLRGLNAAERATVSIHAESFNSTKFHSADASSQVVTLSPNKTTEVEFVLYMGSGMLVWDEFNPQLYNAIVAVKTASNECFADATFGMRKVEIRDRMFYVNGREVQLRGNVENCVFPNTGYPPTEVNDWLKIFRRYKEFGINHVRFHSYCPPEAAFLAADLTGMYIQPEGPSWPNHGVKLGRGEYIDSYLYDEAQRICDVYGNHPSFMFFAFGNEPAGNWVKWCNENIEKIKAYDNRHIYAGFSVGGGWAWQPKSEFAVKAGARGLNEWAKSAPESMADFSSQISVYNGKDAPGTQITVPFVTHEMGQWCAFPNFDEIPKYTGVNRARNFEIFQDILRDNGMESMAKKFLMASGKLQLLCYKYETERILRTPKYAGFQILSLNDYTGQGSALVGVTDAFYGDKGYCTAEDFREFCSEIVPLAKFPKFTYTNDETFKAELSVNNHSASQQLNNTGYDMPDIFWFIEDANGETVYGGDGYEVSMPLSLIKTAQKLTLRAQVGTDYSNHWDFWVYPADKKNPAETVASTGLGMYDGILVTDTLDDAARKALEKGGKVLICAAGKVCYGREVKQQFTPVFWNTSWFKMRPPHTTGVYINNEHPVFGDFPTDYHSDLQWWELVNKAQVMQFTDFPRDFQPIVQSIDTWFVSRKIGMLFEANVGKGRLMMTSMDITRNLDKRIVARQLRKSILAYMASDKFTPEYTISQSLITDLFTKVAGEVNMFTNDSPDELKPKLK